MIVATSVFGSALPALTLVIAALIQMSIVSVSQASTVSRVARSGAARLIGIMVQILQSKTYYFYSYFYTLLGWHHHQVGVLLKAVSVRLLQIVHCCVAWPQPLLSNIKIALFICDKLVIDKTRLHQNC